MAFSAEFRRLRAAHPLAGDSLEILSFIALSRGVQLLNVAAEREPAARQKRGPMAHPLSAKAAKAAERPEAQALPR
jgi:hypothetical protein